jgi:hypothetical protein
MTMESTRVRIVSASQGTTRTPCDFVYAVASLMALTITCLLSAPVKSDTTSS